MEVKDAILCYLFMKATKNENDKNRKALEHIQAALSDWEKEEFDEFCNQKQEQDAWTLLKTTLDEYCSSNEWLTEHDDETYRFRTVLWTLINISYGAETRSKPEIAFINEFASRMKIDSSYIQEIEDTVRTAVVLEKQRDWIDESRLTYSEGKVISEQISKDEELLLKSVDALIRLG